MPISPSRLWQIPAALITLYLFHPACPIHALTGLLCPGCGSTRALDALLQGHLIEALHLNPLFVLLLPIALAYSAVAIRTHRWPRIPPPMIYLACTLTAAFTLIRNLH